MINNRQNGRRRGRGGQQPRNGSTNPHSNNRIDNRQRGNAAQLLEKYKTLARDAQMAGDRVNTEYYLQFADHYFRVLSENRARFEEQQNQQPRGRGRDDYGQDEEAEDEGNPFTRPYTSREASTEEGWDDEDGEGAAPVPQAQPQRDRRDQPPRDRRPVQAERPERDGGEREPADRGQRSGGERNGMDRQAAGERPGGGERGYRGRGPAGANAMRPRAGAAEGDTAPADTGRPEEPSARIEIALPPALTAVSTSSVDAAPELPMEAPIDAATGEETAAPKRRRPRKPKADAAPAEA